MPYCPKCNENDRIEKVRSIYYQNNSQVASKLIPPLKPLSWNLKLGISTNMLVTFVSIISIPACFFGGFLGAFPAFFFFIPLGALVLFTMIDSSKVINQLPAWKKKMEIYERLYYCHRDNCVFDPVTGKTLPADDIYLLYNQVS